VGTCMCTGCVSWVVYCVLCMNGEIDKWSGGRTELAGREKEGEPGTAPGIRIGIRPQVLPGFQGIGPW
jgi:hypothetical protein